VEKENFREAEMPYREIRRENIFPLYSLQNMLLYLYSKEGLHYV